MRSRFVLLSALILVSMPGLAGADPPDPGEDDWPMYGRNPHHSFHNPHAGINTKNVSRLKPAWSFPTSDVVTAAPAVVDGTVYVGSWNGTFYALDQKKGTLKWKFDIDCDNATHAPVPARCADVNTVQPDRYASDGGLITSSAMVRDGRVFFGGGRTLYCLDARSGRLIWKTVVCGNPDDPNCERDAKDGTQILSSPNYLDGNVFVGLSADDFPDYRGGIVAVDARTGRINWRFETDPVLDQNGNVILDARGLPAGGRNRGCGNVWSSAAVDAQSSLVFFGVSDCHDEAPPPYHEAELALDARTGRLRWAFRARPVDICDYDIGASANVIDSGKDRWLGIGGKDGTFYLLDRLTRDPAGLAADPRRQDADPRHRLPLRRDAGRRDGVHALTVSCHIQRSVARPPGGAEERAHVVTATSRGAAAGSTPLFMPAPGAALPPGSARPAAMTRRGFSVGVDMMRAHERRSGAVPARSPSPAASTAGFKG